MSKTQTILKTERRRSREIFARAERVLVGGVNSPVREFRSVGGEPLVIDRARGQFLYDADGNELLDYVCSWGAILLGHSNPAIADAIADQARRGTSFGVTTELELELATLITQAIPFLEKIRFVSSGTEATMSAVRLARGVTKRDFIVKFEGCYHGHADSFLSQAGSGLATLGIAEGPGVPQALAGNPLAMRAGIAALGQLTKPGLYEEMTRLAERLVRGLRAESERAEIAAQINAIGSLATVFFTTGPVRNYADAKRSDTERYARFFREMLARGVFFAPSQFEAAFLSAAHTSENIDRTLAAAHEALQVMAAAEPAV